ncbi:MAG: sigma 54-interacting transcriptional regulator [Pseudomonadota bacterium]
MQAELGDYWETIVETMQDGLIVVNPEGVIVSVNPAMEALTGYGRAELVGQKCGILKCDTCEDVKEAAGQDAHCALFSQGGIRRCRCVLRARDGSPVHVLKNATLLKDRQGQVLGGVETLTDLNEVVSRDKVIDEIRRELDLAPAFQGMIGKSAPMRRLFELIKAAADSLASVLILGESGTGKELVAAAIHALGPRRKGPLVRVNCAALNEALLESELFGHVRGAFTGADRDRIGRFQAASGGDFFLDEVGDLPAATQVKLLRVLQEKVIERVGDHRPIPVDVRLIAATNQDLAGLVRRGRFREDLYFRVAVVPIVVPPLRERREDIPLMVDAFVQRICALAGRNPPEVSRAAMASLAAYAWPGNVRELMNAVEHALVLGRGERLLPAHLPPHLVGECEPPIQAARGHSEGQERERARIQAALNQSHGRREPAARLLGVSRVTLWKRMKQLGVSPGRGRGGAGA